MEPIHKSAAGMYYRRVREENLKKSRFEVDDTVWPSKTKKKKRKHLFNR